MTISDRLTHFAAFYHKEAQRCSRGRAYLAACVMKGAALEGVLQPHLSDVGKCGANCRISPLPSLSWFLASSKSTIRIFCLNEA